MVKSLKITNNPSRDNVPPHPPFFASEITALGLENLRGSQHGDGGGGEVGVGVGG